MLLKTLRRIGVYLIVVGEVVIRNGNGSGAHNSINKAISAIREGIVVNPNVTRPKDGNGIAISHGPPSKMGGGTANHSIASRLTIMDMDAMDDDIGDELDGNAGSISNVNVEATTINGFEAVHNEFLFEGDHHVSLEHNPQRPILNNGMTEGARSGVHRVIVPWVCYYVVPSVTATDGVAAKTNGAISQTLSPEVPTLVAAPAVIHWITRPTREKCQIPSIRVIAYSPV